MADYTTLKLPACSHLTTTCKRLIFTQKFNRYSYCLNNPLKFTEPSGMYFEPIEGQYYTIPGAGAGVQRLDFFALTPLAYNINGDTYLPLFIISEILKKVRK